MTNQHPQAATIMRYLLPLLAFLTAADFPLPCPGQQRRPMSLVELLEVPQLRDPRLSPGGSELLFVLSRADWKVNKRIGHIWRSDERGEAFQLTNGTHGESSPRWSPNGDWIAFLADRDDEEDERNQIYLIRNASGEARQLTVQETSIEDIRW